MYVLGTLKEIRIHVAPDRMSWIQQSHLQLLASPTNGPMAGPTKGAALNTCQPVCRYERHRCVECNAVDSPGNNVRRSLNRIENGEDAGEKKCAGVERSSANYSLKGAKDH